MRRRKIIRVIVAHPFWDLPSSVRFRQLIQFSSYGLKTDDEISVALRINEESILMGWNVLFEESDAFFGCNWMHCHW